MTPEAVHAGGQRTPQGHTHCQDTSQKEWTPAHATLGREHVTGTDTPTGHVTLVTAGYLYQPRMESGISPEPELYKCNTIPILVNIAKIVLTSWISFPAQHCNYLNR